MPVHPLSNFELSEYYYKNKLFGGVYARDEMTSIDNKFYFINLDDSTGVGTHWVCVYNCGDICIYFDPFGIDPAIEILTFMRSSKKQMIMSTYQIQDISSAMCGYFCIYVCNELLNKKQFYDILLEFEPNNYKKNDSLLMKKLNLI